MTKIEALKKTIYNLEKDVYRYNWGNSDSCNCGILAKSILQTDKSVYELGYKSIPEKGVDEGVFSRDFKYCSQTGIEIPLIFKGLADVGFSYEELNHLEYLNDPEILEKSKIPYCEWVRYSQKENLIKYLKAWVEILEEKEKIEAIEPKPEKKKVVYVVVDSPVRDLVKQILEKESN